MIRYRLLCSNGHDFDAWFRSGDDCDRQLARDQVFCAVCGDGAVEKALMAPRVVPSRNKAAVRTGPEEAPSKTRQAEAPVPMAAVPEPARHAISALRELREKITEVSDYVGADFAEEARKIHYGETEQRPIYGEATPQDASALNDEGIDILPLPMLPEDRN